MNRLFDSHVLREVKSLDGAWRFCTDKKDVGHSRAWQNGLSDARSVIVPMAYSADGSLLGYEGGAWFEKEFSHRGGTVCLSFGGVMTRSEIYLDGNKLGCHDGGFGEFSFIAELGTGKHRLTVYVDNRFDENSIPQKFVDWFHDGGIIRDVNVETLEGISILSSRFDYDLDLKTNTATVRLSAELYAVQTLSDTLTAKVGQTAFAAVPVSLNKGETVTVSFPSLTLPDVKLWSPESPTLYALSLATSTDDLTDRVGFRKIEAKDGKILLNGERVELRGINRHDSHPDFGFAVPASVMAHDLDIIEKMGANAVRGCHYPNAQIFLDMCDERGILFWSEIPIWGVGFSVEALSNPKIVSLGKEMHREMLKADFNHPSVVIWGMHNEIRTDTAPARRMTEEYFAYLKENGGNRLVVYATCHPEEDICLDLCDAVCVNMYFGWYSGGLSEWDAFLPRFRAYREKCGVAEKPVIMSEFGAAALYGHHTFDNVPWTEEYQAELLRYTLTLFKNAPDIVGYFPWQFADGRTAPQCGLNRARGYNNKGILNEYRRPKLAFGTVRELYTEWKKKL